MDYPFTPIEHRLYNKTFLKDVRVVVEFPKAELSQVKKEKLQVFFAQFSGADVDIDMFLEKQRINIFSEDHNIEFKFTSENAEAKICTPVYSSFETAKEYWNFLPLYLELINVSEVSRLIVRKYSALYFKSSTADYNVRKFMDEVFCKDLMQLIPTSINSYKALNSIEKTWSKDDEETGTAFTAVFGIKKSDAIDKDDKLTLVISLESKNGMFDRSEIMDRIKEYNKILFDAFHWCVNDEIIEKMK
jgi:hypothetical protein